MEGICELKSSSIIRLIQDFNRRDKDHDGQLTSKEASQKEIVCFDGNNDGQLSLIEIIRSNQAQLGIKAVDDGWLELQVEKIFGAVILPPGTKLKFDDHGEIRALKVAWEKDTKISYGLSPITVKGGTLVEFDAIPNLVWVPSLVIGRARLTMIRATLAADREFWVPNHFFTSTNGQSYSFSVVTAMGGTVIEFGRNGMASRLTLAEDQIIQGRELKAGTEVRFDDSGRLIDKDK